MGRVHEEGGGAFRAGRGQGRKSSIGVVGVAGHPAVVGQVCVEMDVLVCGRGMGKGGFPVPNAAGYVGGLAHPDQ